MPLPNNRAGLLPEIDINNKITLVGCKASRPLSEMVICFNGDVILCCNDMGQEEIVGNLKYFTIEEVWNGDMMFKKIRQIYYGEQSPDNFICKKCEFGITSTSFIKRAIRNMVYESKKFLLTRLW
ncbi:MAG: SPASM domain-containing protein [Planctomycetes bacterium]|nr:SPASM domain-containing protein [Planctomycetota bacterium]